MLFGSWRTELLGSNEMRALVEIRGFTNDLLLPLKRQKERVIQRILKYFIFHVILSFLLSSKGALLPQVPKSRDKKQKLPAHISVTDCP